MTDLQRDITRDLTEIEKQLGSPTFTWKGSTYNLIPSVAEFKRELDTGGFALVKLLTATIRLNSYNCTTNTLTPLFTSLPTAQDKITYSIDGLIYRIESVKKDPTQSYLRIVAEGNSRGI